MSRRDALDGCERPGSSTMLDGVASPTRQTLGSSTAPLIDHRATSPGDDDGLPFDASPALLRVTTGGYYIALQNRLKYDSLLPNNLLEVRRYPPTFVHDILRLPGTLSQLLGKESEMDIMDRVTPAILYGHRALIHPVTKEPCIIASKNPNEMVHSMVVFGQGSTGRTRIHDHYRQHDGRRVKARVAVEILEPRLRASRPEGGRRWERQPISLLSDIWVWAAYHVSESAAAKCTPWTLERFLSGAYHD